MAKTASRGMALEKRVNACNLIYRKKKLALIEKLELGFRITQQGVIPLKSTVDYRGMVKRNNGTIGIAFDAKETKSKTSFPLKNIESHQIEYLRYVDMVGGEAYLLIHFTALHEDEAFLVPISFILEYWDAQFESGPKSIKYKYFDHKHLTKINDYLKLL